MMAAQEHAAAGLFGWTDPREGRPEPGDLCVVGVPSDHGNVVSRGAARGPAAIRRSSMACPLAAGRGWDLGDVDRSDAPDPEPYLDRVRSTVGSVCEAGLVPLVLGGDHAITYAPVSALLESHDLCLVWLDAHTDFSPWPGQGHHNHKQVLRRIAGMPGIRRVVQIGYRGITVGDERSLGRDATVVTSAIARQMGTRDLLALVPEALPCYVSLDIDVLDPLHAPGTSAPVPGGLTPAHVAGFLRELVRRRTIAGMDVTEVNPVLDDAGRTGAVAAALLAEVAAGWEGQRRRLPAGRARGQAAGALL